MLNGDGAEWIRAGRDYLPHCEFQLDRWHLWQAVKVGLSAQPAVQRQLYAALQQGRDWAVLDAILRRRAQRTEAAQRGAIVRLRRYLWENREGLREYRQRGLPVAVQATWRGLGAAEANVDKPWAERFTKRGMSWGRGLAPLVRLVSLQQQRTLQAWLDVCGGRPFHRSLHEAVRTVHRAVSHAEPAAWLQVRLPALAGGQTPLRRTLRALRQPRA
ncbi:MAG: UPF0236 family protein [Armatimonadota bacterium]|nr:UPF0236 family protein [Armatimonadota bacterium]